MQKCKKQKSNLYLAPVQSWRLKNLHQIEFELLNNHEAELFGQMT